MVGLAPTEWDALLLSLRVASVVAAAIAVPATGLGWLLARHSFPGKWMVESAIHAPLVVPPVVTGHLMLLLFGRRGWLGAPLQRIGIQVAFTWQAAAIAGAVVAMPLAVRSARLAFELVDRRFEEAAAVLGYSPARTFRAVTLPLAWPGILGGMLLAFSRSLGEFGATITFAGNIEGVTQTLPLAIYSTLQVPGGEQRALLLSGASLVLCIGSLAISEAVCRRMGSERRSRRK
jgi:molybdate transport system permease protein